MANLVSILIPAYNAERWLGITIRSALNQSWPNKEVIVVNDGSTDATLAIAKTFESKKVKVVTQENQGACAARNTAFTLAQGDFIQWLDADDLMEPDKIAEQLKYAEHDRDCRVLFTSAFASFFFRPRKARFTPTPIWQDLAPVEWMATMFSESCWFNPTAWLMSRKLAEAAGPWDERLSISGIDDGEYICRVAAASEHVKFVETARCYYRVGNFRSLSNSYTQSDRSLESLFLVLKLSIQHLLSLEDSQRTRAASVKRLQSWFSYFYPEKPHIQQKLVDFARELGGALSVPTLPRKYFVLQKFLGLKRAKRAIILARKWKVHAIRGWDYLCWKLG